VVGFSLQDHSHLVARMAGLFCGAGVLSVEGRGKGTSIVATVFDISERTLVGKGPRLCRTVLNHPLLQRQSQPKLRFKQPVRAN
jgi:hypothetical protein